MRERPDVAVFPVENAEVRDIERWCGADSFLGVAGGMLLQSEAE